MRKIWKVKAGNPAITNILSKELKISLPLANLLANRNITNPDAGARFLNPTLSHLYDAGELPDIQKAKTRIYEARDKKQKILIFSDYDADGITALAILKLAFEKLGIKHSHYIPHRVDEGYGLNLDFVKRAAEEKIDLVITLDCGITNLVEIEELRRAGIDVIVVDHHEPLDALPPALAIIDPKRKDSVYPYRQLCAAGLSYKLAGFLLGGLAQEAIELAGIGTIADVVPLLDENRVIAKYGLEKLNATVMPGVQALIEAAGIKNRKLSARDVGFMLGPRINAAGRMGSSEPALKLLLSLEGEEARELAKGLNSKNQERQRIEGKIMEEISAYLERGEVDFAKEKVIVLHGEGWHEGVLGITASKISDRFYRPTVVISTKDGVGRGSGRSIENFHLFESFTACREHLEGFGGHKHAAGLKILTRNIKNFKIAINEIAHSRLTPEDLFPSLPIDAELNLNEVNLDLINELDYLEPFGEENPKPVFASKSLRLKGEPMLLGKGTLKFWVTDGKRTLQAIGFGMGEYLDVVRSAQTLDLAYRVSLDTWQGNNQPQLEIEDIQIY